MNKKDIELKISDPKGKISRRINIATHGSCLKWKLFSFKCKTKLIILRVKTYLLTRRFIKKHNLSKESARKIAKNSIKTGKDIESFKNKEDVEPVEVKYYINGRDYYE